MKKILCVLLLLSVLLCACGGNRGAVTQTSVAPTTQAMEFTETVPETTTEPLSECEKNGHTWVEANYQDPKTCSVCGEIEGEPLPPDFETYNLPLNVAQVDTEYDYVTTCGQNRDAKTVGKFRISDYYIFEGDETHPALDGYEWHKVSFAIRFSDDNAWKWGMGVKTFWDDYYYMEPWGSSDTPSETENVDDFTVNFHGVEYTECLFDHRDVLSFSPWEDHQCTAAIDFYVRIPIGYDGVVVGAYDYSTSWQDGQYLYEFADENTLYFRCDGNVSK